MIGTAAMLLITVWKPHINFLSISTILRYTYYLIVLINIYLQDIHTASCNKVEIKGKKKIAIIFLFGL